MLRNALPTLEYTGAVEGQIPHMTSGWDDTTVINPERVSAIRSNDLIRSTQLGSDFVLCCFTEGAVEVRPTPSAAAGEEEGASHGTDGYPG